MPLTLYFGGGEISKFRQILSEFGSLPISVSFLNIKDRTLPDYPGPILLDSGAFVLNKETSTAEFEDAYEFAAEYMNFVKNNVDDVELVTEFDAKQLGLDTIKQLRREFYDLLPSDRFMPVWHENYGRDELEVLCSSYSVVGVSQEDIHGDMSNVSIFNQMISRYDVKLHGVGITSKKLLESVKWSSVSSNAWLSTTRYGETFVWDGRTLHRYPKSYKERARKTHRSLLINNGFDYEKIEKDNADELLRLSAWSWSRYIQSLNGVTNHTANKSISKTEIANTVVDNQSNADGTASSPVPRETIPLKVRDTAPIPVVFQTVSSNDSGETSPIINVRSQSLRVCDSCAIKNNCPGFEPNSTCLYNIPIEVKTRDQLKAAQNSLTEIQLQRVLFMKMAEDLSGGYSDPNLSSEIDRAQRMLKNMQDADKSTFSMSVNMSQPSGPSFMQKMLGSATSAKLRELETPINADDVIRESELGSIMDAVIVDE